MATSGPPNFQGSSPLTADSFEKELQALAAQAKQHTWSRLAIQQAAVLVKAASLLGLAAFYSNVSQLSLSPVYGSIPAAIWHPQVVMMACFLGWSSNLWLKRQISADLPHLLPLIALCIPTAQYFLFKQSSLLGPTYGPILTEALTFLPLLFISVACAATVLQDLDLSSLSERIADATPGIGSYMLYKAIEYVSRGLIHSHIGSSLVQSRLGLQMLLSAIYSSLFPSKLLVLAIPSILHTLFFNVHLRTPLTTARLNSTMSDAGWTVLARQDSLTGYISVLESSEDGFRVMRCDHSLLGGEWLARPGDSSNSIREPIYGVFAMLEAVRLVNVPSRLPDADASALVM